MKYIIAALISLLSLNTYAETLTLTTQNTIILRGEITDESMMLVQLKLAALNKKRGFMPYELYLVLDSPGGSINAGVAFIEFAKTIRNLSTISLVAASMASGIVEALPGKRYVTSNGYLMFHRAKGGFEGQFEEGEVEQELALMKRVVLFMETTTAKRMGLSVKDYKDKIKDEYWLYGEDAVTKKAADSLVTLTCTSYLIDSREAAIYQTIFGAVYIEFSGCPLFRGPLASKQVKPPLRDDD